jgi:hypothetical protein
MRTTRKDRRSSSLGELITILFDESRNVSSNRFEQNLIVYVALKDLLKSKIHSKHRISLKPY